MIRSFLFVCLLVFSVTSFSSISPRTYNALNDLQASLAEAATPKEFQEIKNDLLELKQSLSGNALGLALTLQILAQLQDVQGDAEAAINSLKTAFAIKGLDSNTKGQLGISLAYMYFSQGQYNNSILVLNDHLNSSKKDVSANVLALLAMSYFSIEDFQQGLPLIEKACKIAKTPNESWLANAFAASYKLGDLEKAMLYTDQLVYNFPDKADYWNQKVGLHQSAEQYKQAAIIGNLSYRQGYLTKEAQLYNLGILMASSGAPYEVAVTLDQALSEKVLNRSEKVARLLMQAWLQAKEIDKAIIELKLLYSEYNKPKDGVLLVNYLMEAERWTEALDISASLAVLPTSEEYTVKQKGAALLMMGVSYYRNGQVDKALIALGKASGIKDSSSQAKSWMSYIKQMEG